MSTPDVRPSCPAPSCALVSDVERLQSFLTDKTRLEGQRLDYLGDLSKRMEERLAYSQESRMDMRRLTDTVKAFHVKLNGVTKELCTIEDNYEKMIRSYDASQVRDEIILEKLLLLGREQENLRDLLEIHTKDMSSFCSDLQGVKGAFNEHKDNEVKISNKHAFYLGTLISFLGVLGVFFQQFIDYFKGK